MRDIIKHPQELILFLEDKGCFNLIPDEYFLKLMYWSRIGKNLNLKKPITYNEKLQWLKLYDRRNEMITYVDKYAIRDYIKDTIGDKYLVPLLGVYYNFDEIDFGRLPEQFVLKCTHDSGGIVICKEKNKLDVKVARKIIEFYLKRKFYYHGREWPYKYVKPRIICEQYLQDNITDYKLMCFHGEPKLIQVHRNRNTNRKTMDFYDVAWNKTPIRRKTPTAKDLIPQPQQFDEMLSISRKLSKNEIHVRIDLYEVDGKVYFSEKTYYSASGMEPFLEDKYDELIGSWIQLPREKHTLNNR
jgi:hypothetical protein